MSGTTVFSKPLTGYRFVDTLRGDTLQKVAARELGDAGQWGNLISYNNLVPPYLTDDPTQVKEGVLLTGSQILVPAGAPVVSTTTDPKLVYQVDALLKNGLLQVENGDFATVSGIQNLAQALKNNVETPQGALLWHTSYGSLCRRINGAINGPTQAQLVEAYAIASLETDERVQEVDKAIATISGDSISLQLEVIPVVGRPIQLTALP
jgi:phage baseplate assembly protein W